MIVTHTQTQKPHVRVQRGYSGGTGGIQAGYRQGTAGVQRGYSGGTAGVERGYSRGTAGVKRGYSGGTAEVQRGTAGVQRGYGQSAEFTKKPWQSWLAWESPIYNLMMIGLLFRYCH